MNSTEQKQRHTAVTELRDEVATMIDALLKSVGQQLEQEHQAWTKEVGDERTHRLKLADEQRSYVDSADRDLRRCCQERWDATSQAQVRIIAMSEPLRRPTFWGRLRWLVLGR